MTKFALIVTLNLLLISKISFGQQTTYYHKNIFENTFTKCENPPTFGDDSLALEKYLSEKLQSEILKCNGQIKVSLLIDKEGKAMCESITNNSNFKMNKIKLDLLFDTMPNWSSPLQNGHKVNCVEQVLMIFNKQTLIVTYKNGMD
jgi:hypothetical protein